MTPRRLKQRYRAAARLRRAARRMENALYTRDRGYGRGKRFYFPPMSDGLYNRASEILGLLESEARILEGECS